MHSIVVLDDILPNTKRVRNRRVGCLGNGFAAALNKAYCCMFPYWGSATFWV